MVLCFCLISWRLFDGLILYWGYWINVTQTLKWNYICRPVTYISWSIDFALYMYLEDYLMDKCHNVIVGILDPCDAKINHIKCMWVTDLHFVVQWFWLLSWRRFDGGMLDWRYWFSVTLRLTSKYICRSVTYTFWYSDSALYFQCYFMNKPHSLDISFDMGHWPVFHDQVILNHLPISPGAVARSEASSLGMQAARSLIPTSGTFFHGDLVMNYRSKS